MGNAIDIILTTHLTPDNHNLVSKSIFCQKKKQTTYDNKSRYQTDVTDTLNRNFYVDDLLKSVKDVNTAIKLLHDVISMCADGGFRLTKFLSN